MKVRIPDDVIALAKARGLRIQLTGGAFAVSERGIPRYSTGNVAELRRWLHSIESRIKTA